MPGRTRSGKRDNEVNVMPIPNWGNVVEVGVVRSEITTVQYFTVIINSQGTKQKKKNVTPSIKYKELYSLGTG